MLAPANTGRDTLANWEIQLVERDYESGRYLLWLESEEHGEARADIRCAWYSEKGYSYLDSIQVMEVDADTAAAKADLECWIEAREMDVFRQVVACE